MLNEYFSKKENLNVVNTIQGGELKIDDVLQGDFKDCLGLIVKDINFYMEKKKWSGFGRVNVFEPIKDEELMNVFEEEGFGILRVGYSSDNKTWMGRKQDSNLENTEGDDYTNHTPPESFKGIHEEMVSLIKISLQPYSTEYRKQLRFKNVKRFFYDYELLDLRSSPVQDYFLKTFQKDFVKQSENQEIKVYKVSDSNNTPQSSL